MRTGVLLLHGLTGMPSELRPLEKFLSCSGFDTEAPVLAGHGGTHHELIATKWNAWVASARTAMNSLLERNERVIIMGLSMGGTIGAILAAEQPERVTGLVMLSPTLSYDGSNLDNLVHQRPLKNKILRDTLHALVGTMPFLGKILYWTETPPYGLKDARLQAKITRSIEAAKAGGNTEFGLFRTYFSSLYQMNLLTDQFRRTASGVTCPVLIMHSFEDTLASLGNATDTFELVYSSEKRLVVLTGCDHVMTLDLQRHYVCKLVGDFVRGVTAREMESVNMKKPAGLSVELTEALSDRRVIVRVDEAVQCVLEMDYNQPLQHEELEREVCEIKVGVLVENLRGNAQRSSKSCRRRKKLPAVRRVDVRVKESCLR